jgi:hypothetical protein
VRGAISNDRPYRDSQPFPANCLYTRRLDLEIPEPPQAKIPSICMSLPNGDRVTSSAILGGLHHKYVLEKEAA